MREHDPEIDHKPVESAVSATSKVITSRNPAVKDERPAQVLSLREYATMGTDLDWVFATGNFCIREKLTRIGIASFVRPRKKDDVNFGESEQTEEEHVEEEAAIARGAKKREYWSDEDFKKKVLPNVVSSGGTWGPITSEVGRVEITII